MNSLFSEIQLSGGNLLHTLLVLLICGIVLGIIWWLIQQAPFLNELFKKVLGYIVILFGALILINALLSLVGHPLVSW